ncbi:poly-gamma-glutamate synthesis protein (capsule biosynthesis protein) [Melghirimyces profundicolus]|uniref:Poly-gamma-glutamate synthesis protein (Capsule biosynthesis protein) n=1 Tax=Melghirimyces profundicolus TaxID=1242148 RepID=A0A2T6BG86_9BACL|nr:CapA family protein [Melghirimyces profundicolus]PTX55051.1 poly-gamma-glutamate synthesis protein (capsule biosynthesis protein) [Melghirimyces profundicolus]
MKRPVLTLLILVLSLWTSACLPSASWRVSKSGEERQTDSTSPSTRLRLAVVGDIMMHASQIRSGRQKNRTYDYSPFFREIKPYLEQADLALGNLETTFPGNHRSPYTGYPRFRSPDALGIALKTAGFDLLSTANNHSMDAGESGVVRTFQKLKEWGIQPVGTSAGNRRQSPVLVNKNGLTLSFAAYTYGTNGIPIPPGKDHRVNRMDEERIRKDIRLSKRQGADYVIVLLHMGSEYQRQPNREQQRWFRSILKSGADAVIGAHPHVLQPMTRIKMDGGEKFVAYSMGNFISDQTQPYTNDGLILYLDLVREGSSQPVRLQNVSYVPTYVHKYRQNQVKRFVVIPIDRRNGNRVVPSYPGLSRISLERTWERTTSLMSAYERFPTFSREEGASP